MEFPIHEAKVRLSELVSAAQNGERVILTEYDEPIAKLVSCQNHSGIDFEKLESTQKHLGILGNREG